MTLEPLPPPPLTPNFTVLVKVLHQTTWSTSGETCIQARKQQLELDMEQQTGSKSGKMYVLSPCLFNLYEEYITRNARLDEAQAGIKIAGGCINNLRYADDTTFMQNVKKN